MQIQNQNRKWGQKSSWKPLWDNNGGLSRANLPYKGTNGY